MLWHVGDMTAMEAYADQSFDLVFDKGALDALMSEDSAAVRDKARSAQLGCLRSTFEFTSISHPHPQRHVPGSAASAVGGRRQIPVHHIGRAVHIPPPAAALRWVCVWVCSCLPVAASGGPGPAAVPGRRLALRAHPRGSGPEERRRQSRFAAAAAVAAL